MHKMMQVMKPSLNHLKRQMIAAPRRQLGILATLKKPFSRNKRELSEIEITEAQRGFFERKKRSWNGDLAIDTEIFDLTLVDKFVSLSRTLSTNDFPENHPINIIHNKSNDLLIKLWKEEETSVRDKPSKLRYLLTTLSEYYHEEQEQLKLDIENFNELSKDTTFGNKWRWNCETALRLSVIQLYYNRLLTAIDAGDIAIDNIHDDKDSKDSKDSKDNKEDKINLKVLLNLSEVFLIGSGNDRIEQHLALYPTKIDQAQLQDAFYMLYEPEVEACTSALTIVKGKHKDYIKMIPKFSKTYLLDRLELNVKSRCVFCWSDPAFAGIKPPEDDHQIDVKTLLESRKEFFDEGHEIGSHCIGLISSDRRQHYADAKEFNQDAKRGFAFFIGCCVLDGIFTYM
jgi:hypothetical protein